MSDNTPFWHEVRGGLMVRGDGWKPVVESLPRRIDYKETEKLLQSADQLTTMSGFGQIAGLLAQARPDKRILLSSLRDTELTVENLALQWLYRFMVVEGLCEHNRREPLGEWNPMFLGLVEDGLHFMVYTAAMLVLAEEGGHAGFFRDRFEVYEPTVRGRVAEACEFLHPKAQDYGESFRRHGLPGLLPRLWDKIARYAQLKADNRPSNFEKMEDSARDLLGYSCVAYSLMLELPDDIRESYGKKTTYEVDLQRGTWTETEK